MKTILQNIYKFIIGKRLTNKLIIALSRIAGINLIALAYQQNGISDFNDYDEANFIQKHLVKLLKSESPLILFDIGANKGNFTSLLNDKFQDKSIHSFEPNKSIFSKLNDRYKDNKDIWCNNFGLGQKKENRTLFTNSANDTELGSLYSKVQIDLHKSDSVISEEVSISTLDSYAKEMGIEYIDFLKIDTEGHELAVLMGANKMLSEGRIKIIQFEFNEMNIISRSFMKDFYEVLPNYKFYRIYKRGIIELGEYNSSLEIFKYQNIIAISNKLNI